MQASQTPTLVPLAFAANGTKNTIPEASQIGITPGAASLNDGFPPLTMTPIAAGGVPPAGADMNGILNLVSAPIRWSQGGGLYAYSSSFANDSNVGGYPQGAELMSADLQGTWISLNDSNTDNPDTGAGTKWVPGRAYGITPVTGLTNANVTLTPAQAAKNKITLAGTLTANVQIIFPTWTREWEVVNNTTGAFTVTAKTSAGTGIVLAAGQQKITGDGTNITQPAESIAPATASQHAVQFGQVSGVVGQVRNLVMSVTAASSTASLTADEIVLETALGGLRYCVGSASGSINLATTGAGGMDTGSAPTSGFVAIYGIFNGTTFNLLATNATSTVAPSIYAGGHMPSGYTASALLSVWPTNSSGQFGVGYQRDRHVAVAPVTVLSTTTSAASLTSLSISNAVPKNALFWDGSLTIGASSSSGNVQSTIAPASAGTGIQQGGGYITTGTATYGNIIRLPILTAQTTYYTASASVTTTLIISGYDF